MIDDTEHAIQMQKTNVTGQLQQGRKKGGAEWSIHTPEILLTTKFAPKEKKTQIYTNISVQS